MRPESYARSDDGGALVLFWSGEPDALIPAPRLREAARDAGSIRQRLEQGDLVAPTDLTITFIEPMGSMGVNIGFSDGHDRAVYPWDYLRALAKPALAKSALSKPAQPAEPQPANVN